MCHSAPRSTSKPLESVENGFGGQSRNSSLVVNTAHFLRVKKALFLFLFLHASSPEQSQDRPHQLLHPFASQPGIEAYPGLKRVHSLRRT
jgi:hypothetical protein